MWVNVIAPLLALNNVAVIGGTSPLDVETSWMARMLQKTDKRGNPIFHVLLQTLACHACTVTGKAISCRHMENKRNDWKSAERFDLVKRLIDDTESTERELMGVVVDASDRPFTSDRVRSLADRTLVDLSGISLAVLYVVVDPAAGGTQSWFAVSTFAVTPTRVVIVAMDVCKTPSDVAYTDTLMGHVAALRRDPRFENSLLVYLIEANLSKTAADRYSRLLHQQRSFAPHWSYSWDEQTNGLAGCWTTNATKLNGIYAAQRLLQDASVFFIRDMLTQYPSGAAVIKDIFYEQLIGMTRIVKEPIDPVFGGTPIVTFTGKSTKGKDDLVMVFIIAIHWAAVLSTHRDFTRLLNDTFRIDPRAIYETFNTS